MKPLLTVVLCLALFGQPATAAAPAPAPSFEAFTRDLSPLVAARLDATPKHYRQIEPSLFHLATDHASSLAALSRDQQVDVLVKLARFIDRKREAIGDAPVIAPGRALIGLLDPDRGLDPKEITAIASGYGATATVFKKDGAGETIGSVADDFLTAVTAAAAGATPTTIIVLGHGLPTEIQSYSIPCARLAHALVDGAASQSASASDGPRTATLGHLVLICDDCYSADFSINLAAAIEETCRDRGLALASLPCMIAGTNRDCVGHADFGEKFVPHFWKDVIELFYVRKPRPAQITLRDFFEKVDNMMYGYGRAPQVDGSGTVTYRLVDPQQCQDPVVFIPLDAEDLAALRAILDLPAEATLLRLLDIG